MRHFWLIFKLWLFLALSVGMPSIRSLETLHNALSLKQLDAFLHYISTTAFKTPCPSPARTSSPTYRGPQMSRQSSEYISKLANCMLDVQNNFAMYKITDCFSPIFDFFAPISLLIQKLIFGAKIQILWALGICKKNV